MMGYTHAVIGASAALAVGMITGESNPGTYEAAAIMGALGGIAVDIDVKDQFDDPKVTDGLRSKLAVLGLLVLGAILAFIFKLDIIAPILTNGFLPIVGLVIFVVALIIGFISPHRTFSHSLWFVLITSIGIGLISYDFAIYYCVGCLLHIFLDFFNHKINNSGKNHGVWLLYPIRIGKGIAFGWCKAAGKGNKAFYFIGLILFILQSVSYIVLCNDKNGVKGAIVPIVIMIYMIIVMHLVRRKTEKEMRHIDHMQGE